MSGWFTYVIGKPMSQGSNPCWSHRPFLVEPIDQKVWSGLKRVPVTLRSMIGTFLSSNERIFRLSICQGRLEAANLASKQIYNFCRKEKVAAERLRSPERRRPPPRSFSFPNLQTFVTFLSQHSGHNLFLKMGQPGLYNVHPVYGARIRTHDLQVASIIL